MKKTIFLVEDTADLRVMVEYLLTKQGFNVVSFGNAQTYLTKISTEIPDLVILDIMLPDGNGIDLCTQLKNNKATSTIPVLLMSANIYSKGQVTETADVQFISKPFDIDDFTETVQRMAG